MATCLKGSLSKALVHRALGYSSYLKKGLCGGAVLNFHSVRNVSADECEWTRALAVSPDFFERMIGDLRRRGIAIVSLTEALRRTRLDASSGFVAITFDDGYADNFYTAFPILQRLDVPFAVFLATGFIDRTVPMWWSVLAAIVRDNDHIVLPHSVLPAAHASQKAAALSTGLELFRNAKSGEIAGLVDEVIASNPKSSARNEALAKPLTWFMVKTMARSGLATFGCHTVSHPVLARLDRESAEQEICLARDRLADELGRPPTFFAYPYGGDPDIGSGAPALVARAGFTAAFTTRRAVLCGSDLDSPYMLPRIAVSGLYQHRTALRAYLLMAEKGW